MKKFCIYIYVYSYLLYVTIAMIYGGIINHPCKEFHISGKSFKIDILLLAFLILIATSLSYWAVVRFHNDKITIIEGVKNYSSDEGILNKISKRFLIISNLLLKIGILVLSFLAGYVVVNKASLNLEDKIKAYAIILVGILISITFYAYINFIIIIISIKDIYNLEFEDYIRIYPVATEVFEKYIPIFSFGLILFWLIGLILIVLSIIVFSEDAFLVITIIGTLILFGYLFFTFYPYYITRRKVNMLKLQTIREICREKDLMDKAVFDQYSGLIKYVLDSPDIMSTNFHLIITSTLAAIIGLFTSIISFFK